MSDLPPPDKESTFKMKLGATKEDTRTRDQLLSDNATQVKIITNLENQINTLLRLKREREDQATLTKDELIEHLIDNSQELSWRQFFIDELIRHLKECKEK